MFFKKLIRKKYPELLCNIEEEGFVDMTFLVENLVELDSEFEFTARAIHHNNIVGLKIVMDKNITNSLNEQFELIEDNVYRKSVKFMSLGTESDQLITDMNSMYGLGNNQLKMRNEISFTAIVLHNSPVNLKSDSMKIKLFGNDEDPINEDFYYESFLNIDLKNKIVEWNEKDLDYREPLIKSVSNEQ